MADFVSIFLLLASGFLFVRSRGGGLSSARLLALPVGLGAWSVFSCCWFIFGFSFSWISLAIFFALSLVLWFSGPSVQRCSVRSGALKFLESFSFFSVLSLLVFVVNELGLGALSYDSFLILQLASILAVGSAPFGDIIGSLGSWGFGGISVHIPFFILRGEGYNFGLHTLALFNLLAIIFRIAFVARGSRVLATLIVTAVGTAGMFLFQGFYIHNSILSALFLASLLWLANYEDDQERLNVGLLVVFGIGFILTRMEASIMLAVVVAYVFPFEGRQRVFSHFVWTLAALASLWFGFLFVSLDGHSDILTPVRAVFLILPWIALSFFVLLSPAGRVRVLTLGKWFGGALLVSAFIYKTDHIGRSLENLSLNVFVHHGRWSYLWYFIVIAWITRVFKKDFEGGTRAWEALSLMMVVLVSLSLFRSPFRLGWGDSANRILTYFVPVFLAALFPMKKKSVDQFTLAGRF